MATKRRKRTPAELFLAAAQQAIEAGEVMFDADHFGKRGKTTLRGITEEDVYAVLLCADAADCERAAEEPARPQEKWVVRGVVDGERAIVVVTLLNVRGSLFVVTAHHQTRGTR